MNIHAVNNVKYHLYVKMDECEKAEEKAKKENMSEERIRIYHDMYLLYLRLMVEPKNIAT